MLQKDGLFARTTVAEVQQLNTVPAFEPNDLEYQICKQNEHEDSSLFNYIFLNIRMLTECSARYSLGPESFRLKRYLRNARFLLRSA